MPATLIYNFKNIVMDKFKTIEEAQSAYDKIVEENKTLVANNAALEENLKSEIKRAAEAEKVAIEINSKLEGLEKYEDIFVTVKKKKYKVNFGVDGKSKEELKEDAKLLERLVEIQSGALTLVD